MQKFLIFFISTKIQFLSAIIRLMNGNNFLYLLNNLKFIQYEQGKN